MRASVLIPTYRRPDDLRRCLAGLGAGTRRPDEILVVHRPDDHASAAVVAEFDMLPVRALPIDRPGQVAAINRGLGYATGDFIALIDDDAIPYPDWLERIERWYAQHPRVGGVGGRDVVHQGPPPPPPSEGRVGLISWYGRMIGNHHIGLGDPRPVHVLKGANMSFRREAVQDLRADVRLEGAGAQVHNEVGVCAAIRRRGWTLIYDPLVLVDHYPAMRHDEDARTGFSAVAQRNTAHNEQLAVLDALPGWGRMPFLVWSFAIGTAQVPGLVQLPRLLARRDPVAVPRMLASWRGRLAGLATWWSSARPSDAFNSDGASSGR